MRSFFRNDNFFLDSLFFNSRGEIGRRAGFKIPSFMGLGSSPNVSIILRIWSDLKQIRIFLKTWAVWIYSKGVVVEYTWIIIQGVSYSFSLFLPRMISNSFWPKPWNLDFHLIWFSSTQVISLTWLYHYLFCGSILLVTSVFIYLFISKI